MRLFRNATLSVGRVRPRGGSRLHLFADRAEGRHPPSRPKPPATQVTYNVTVTANPPDIVSGGTGSSTITVDVRRTDTGQAPPDGTVVALTTTLGGFNSRRRPADA